MKLLALCLLSLARAGAVVYPRSEAPTTNLSVIAEEGRTRAELILIDSLAGYLARRSPRLYRVGTAGWRTDAGDSYGVWLRDAVDTRGVAVDEALVSAPVGSILAAFDASAALAGYLRANATDASVSAALTLAAASDDGLAVAADAATAAAAEAAGLALIEDVRGTTVADALASLGAEGVASLSAQTLVFQDPSKAEFLGACMRVWTRVALAHNSDRVLCRSSRRLAGAGLRAVREDAELDVCDFIVSLPRDFIVSLPLD